MNEYRKKQVQDILLSYFNPTECVGSDIFCGSLSITNVGLNSVIGSKHLREDGMIMCFLSEKPGYGIFDVMEGCLESEDGEQEDALDIVQGKSKTWKLIEFIISDNCGTDGNHFINLVVARTPSTCEEVHSETWFKENCVTLFYGDSRRTVLLLNSHNCRPSYLVNTVDDEDDVSFVEVTEFIEKHKTRTFRRWFRQKDEYDNAWEITIYAR